MKPIVVCVCMYVSQDSVRVAVQICELTIYVIVSNEMQYYTRHRWHRWASRCVASTRHYCCISKWCSRAKGQTDTKDIASIAPHTRDFVQFDDDDDDYYVILRMRLAIAHARDKSFMWPGILSATMLGVNSLWRKCQPGANYIHNEFRLESCISFCIYHSLTFIFIFIITNRFVASRAKQTNWNRAVSCSINAVIKHCRVAHVGATTGGRNACDKTIISIY